MLQKLQAVEDRAGCDHYIINIVAATSALKSQWLLHNESKSKETKPNTVLLLLMTTLHRRCEPLGPIPEGQKRLNLTIGALLLTSQGPTT